MNEISGIIQNNKEFEILFGYFQQEESSWGMLAKWQQVSGILETGTLKFSGYNSCHYY